VHDARARAHRKNVVFSGRYIAELEESMRGVGAAGPIEITTSATLPMGVLQQGTHPIRPLEARRRCHCASSQSRDAQPS